VSSKKKEKTRNIGIVVKMPKEVCDDEFCPFHGELPVRQRTVEGVVVSSKAQKTAVIERQYLTFLPKYERYERRHSRISAYNPSCISAKEGDWVKLAECRPLSKTKHHVVVEVVKKVK